MSRTPGLRRLATAALMAVTFALLACAAKQETRQPPSIDRSRIDAAFKELDGAEPAERAARRSPTVEARSAVAADRGPRPGWASRGSRPTDRTYYHGIGSSRNTLEEARTRALGDLSGEIEVRVTSEVTSFVEERGYSGRGGDSQIVSADSWAVQALAQQTIREPEWVGHWAGDGEYWSYVRLSRERFKADLELELAEARQLAIDHLRSAGQAERRGDVVTAAREFVRGLEVLRRFLGRPIHAELYGDSVDLGNELRRGADRMVSAIELVRQGKGSLLVTAGKGVAQDLEVSVRHDGRALSGVPIRYAFTRGQGSVVSPVQSDNRGRARSHVARIDAAGTHVLEARVDLASLAFGDTEPDPGLFDLLGQVAGQSAEFHIGGVAKRFYIEVREENLGAQEPDSYLARILKSRLGEEGAVQFARNAASADFLLRGTASTRFSSKIGTIVFCYADVSLTLVDGATNTELYATRQAGVKGADKSEVDAAQRAMEKAAEQVTAEVLRFIRAEVQP